MNQTRRAIALICLLLGTQRVLADDVPAETVVAVQRAVIKALSAKYVEKPCSIRVSPRCAKITVPHEIMRRLLDYAQDSAEILQKYAEAGQPEDLLDRNCLDSDSNGIIKFYEKDQEAYPLVVISVSFPVFNSSRNQAVIGFAMRVQPTESSARGWRGLVILALQQRDWSVVRSLILAVT